MLVVFAFLTSLCHAEVTENQVKLALAQEEARDLEHGEGSIVHDTLSPSVLITTGMDFVLQQ